MRAISFAYTTEALVAGAKTCTRRDWQDRYARSFKVGEVVAAYDRQPRFRGREVATIRLTAAPEYTAALPETDYAAEGFVYMQERGLVVDGVAPQALWRLWRRQAQPQWVVRFELLNLTPYGEDLRAKALARKPAAAPSPQLPFALGE